ncbi:MAG TPA: DUF6527 family protein [Terriglobia bacterium]|nr:DUF6527 family protein [Terriglobia bacterium]
MTETPTRGAHVGAGIDIDDIAEPGCFQYQDLNFKPLDDPSDLPEGSKIRIAFYTPNGIRGAVVATKNAASDGWQWDGSTFAPTITPSIKVTGHDAEWHGYLTKGEWVPCSA